MVIKIIVLFLIIGLKTILRGAGLPNFICMAKIAKIETNLAKLGFTPELVSLLLKAGKQAIFLGNKVIEYSQKNNIALNEFCNNSFNTDIVNEAINQVAAFKNSNNGNIEPIKQLELQQLAYLSNYLQINYNELNQIVIDYRVNGIGFYWAYLGYSITKHVEESNRMANCGIDNDCYIFSLRKFSGNGMNESLVTLSVRAEDFAISQVKSYGNSPLAKKYIGFFFDLCKELNLEYIKFLEQQQMLFEENETLPNELRNFVDLENVIKFGVHYSNFDYIVNEISYKNSLIININNLENEDGDDWPSVNSVFNAYKRDLIDINELKSILIEMDATIYYDDNLFKLKEFRLLIYDIFDIVINKFYFPHKIIFNHCLETETLTVIDCFLLNKLNKKQTDIIFNSIVEYCKVHSDGNRVTKFFDYSDIRNKYFLELIKDSSYFPNH